jgi:hypothetical protein
MRIERERRAESDAAWRIERRRLTHAGWRDPLRVQSRSLARLELPPQHFAVVTRRNLDVVAGFQATLDSEPSDECSRVERRASPAFKNAPGSAKTVPLGDVAKGWTRFRQK